MQFDLSMPAQLTSALGPDLLLMGGAMLLLLWSGWRRESDSTYGVSVTTDHEDAQR